MKKITVLKSGLVAGLLLATSLNADEFELSSAFENLTYNATAQYGSSGIIGGEVSAMKKIRDRVVGAASVKYLDYNADGHSLKGSIKAFYALTDNIIIGGGPGILYSKTYEEKEVWDWVPPASAGNPTYELMGSSKEANYMTKPIAEASIVYGLGNYGYVSLAAYIHDANNFNINIEAPIITYNTNFGALGLGVYAESTVIDSQTINHVGVLAGVTF